MIHSVTLFGDCPGRRAAGEIHPLTRLSAVLLVVGYAWANGKIPELWRGPKSDFIVLVVTFMLTAVFDLTIAVGVGLTMAGALFVKRMEEITHIRLVTADSELDVGGGSIRDKEIPEGVLVYRIEGPFFFGAAEKLETALIGIRPCRAS